MQGLSTIVALMAIMGCGWTMKRLGKFDEAGIQALSTLLYWLLMPVGIFRSGLNLRPDSLSSWHYPLALYGSFTVTLLVAWLVTGLRGLPPRRRAVSMLMCARPNVIFLALPLLTMLMGRAGEIGMALYIGLGTLYYNFVPILAAQLALEGTLNRQAVRRTFRAALSNPLLLSGILGISLSFTGAAAFLPRWFHLALDVLAQGANGLALLVIGASLKPERILSDARQAWVDLLLKLALLPAATAALFFCFPVADRSLMEVAIIASGVSPAFNCFIIAKGMGMDSDYAASFLACATVLGLFSSAVWINLAPLLIR